MDKYTQLSPEMQELWDYKMKEFEEQLSNLKKEELYKMLNNDIQEEYDTKWIPNVGSFEFNLEYLANEEEYQQASQSLSDYAEQLKQSTDSRIITLKYQLKHCKNYLERQNIERELNRLYKERR